MHLSQIYEHTSLHFPRIYEHTSRQHTPVHLTQGRQHHLSRIGSLQALGVRPTSHICMITRRCISHKVDSRTRLSISHKVDSTTCRISAVHLSQRAPFRWVIFRLRSKWIYREIHYDTWLPLTGGPQWPTSHRFIDTRRCISHKVDSSTCRVLAPSRHAPQALVECEYGR